MRVREADENDKQLWDSFITTQEGSFNYYFDCRYLVANNIIQLIVETDQSQLISLCRLDIKQKKSYSSLTINGILYKKDETEAKKYIITLELLKHIEDIYSKRCSTFRILELNTLGCEVNGNGKNAFLDYKFRLRKGFGQNLPCSHILALKAPFEENIWKGLWSQKLRQDLNNVAKRGVKVVQDREFKYLEDYLDMSDANYDRHRTPPPSRSEKIDECNVFKDKTKLFVALLNDQPIVILKCHYTASTCYLSGVGSYTKGTDDINKFCYKAAIEDACNNGYKYADFGYSYTEGLAKLKERFRFTRLTIKEYEKRYSFLKVLLEITPQFINIMLHNPKYIWGNRVYFWDRIVRW